ncbi:winged helix-turn-helix domain-containing protein [Stackebrandtia endophytica]|nr:helix-turn-helix domain-containing protein [Stackebrandtia endophytica]
MTNVAVISDPAAAEASLDPIRARLLTELVEPASAADLARRLDVPRQKINYHLKALENHGLIELVAERPKGNFTERIMRTTADEYLIAPQVMGAMTPDPDRSPDRLSARWLLAIATRLIREVGDLITGAARTDKRVATFTIDGRVRFASAAERAAFATELTEAVTGLVAKYHTDAAPAGRDHRVIVALHAVPPTTEPDSAPHTKE